mgnify:CR=1 FL=1
MRIAVPTEIKDSEFRAAADADMVHELVRAGNSVTVQAGAGTGSGVSDEQYRKAGATVVEGAEAVWDDAELVLKVKELLPCEYRYLRPDLTLFTYLHLAADESLTRALMESGATAIAYETVTGPLGGLPLLAPMSEIAGRMSVPIGAAHLMSYGGGSGVLLSGVPGTRRGKVAVIGGGTAGQSAAMMAVGLGAEVTVLDISLNRLRQLEGMFGSRVNLLASNQDAIARAVSEADLVIGSVLIPGAKAPKLVTNDMVAQMRPGSVLVDIAIDQGGCFEGSHPTKHTDPTFEVNGAIFYCVANMPGAYPQTATAALTNATLPYVLEIAGRGVQTALLSDPGLSDGVNTFRGHLVNQKVAAAFDLPWTPLKLDGRLIED